MKNTYRIIWSEVALNNLKVIVDFIESRWTERKSKNPQRLKDKLL